MSRNQRYIVYIYIAGAVMTEAALVLNAYEGGGFQRAHSVSNLIVLIGIYLTAGALWPALITTLALQYLGILPRLMG